MSSLEPVGLEDPDGFMLASHIIYVISDARDTEAQFIIDQSSSA